MSQKDRIKEYIAYLKIGQGAFEKNVGISNGYVNNIKKSIGSGVLSKIQKTYPELNINWIVTGEGSMFSKHLEQKAEELEFEYTQMKNKLLHVSERSFKYLDKLEAAEEEIRQLKNKIQRLEELLKKERESHT